MNSDYDMLFEILTRTTLETMDTCKVVSKDLNKLLNDSWFIKNYSQRTKNIFGYFVQTLIKNNILSTSFVSIDPMLRTPSISLECFEEGLKILATSSQGILCCGKFKNRSYHYYVCKPSTRQCVALPSPRGQAMAPGKVSERVALIILKSNPLHYKIIRFGEARRPSPGQKSYIIEVFDSKIWRWRQSENLVAEQCMIFGRQPCVCIGGIVYWLTNRDTVLAFDSETETHSEFLAPTAVLEDEKGYQNKKIVEYKGKLGFTCENNSDEVLLWGLEDRRNYNWEIKRVVRIDKQKNRLIGCSLADMALMSGYRLQVYERSGFRYPINIFPFRSDWEPVNLENGRND